MNAQKSQVKPPLVSIITATYNDETYIESSIRSVLSQDFTDFEYLIINDGSTDNTKKIVQRLQKEDSRIRLINQKNSGLVASLNRGITEARGTYIARIDGDDEWLPHKLKTQVAMLEANKNLVLVGGGAEIMNQDSVPTGFIFNVARNEDIRLGLCIFNQFCHSSVIYRRQAALDAGLYPDTCPAEDYDLFSKFPNTVSLPTYLTLFFAIVLVTAVSRLNGAMSKIVSLKSFRFATGISFSRRSLVVPTSNVLSPIISKIQLTMILELATSTPTRLY